jgi:serine/threonine protein kinase
LERYEVIQTLAKSNIETTELVYKHDKCGEGGGSAATDTGSACLNGKLACGSSSADTGGASSDAAAGAISATREQGQLFVRKIIHMGASLQAAQTGAELGVAYERIFRAQRCGRAFGHLPQIYEYCKVGSDIVVVMEYLPGKTLAQTRACGPVEPWVFSAICDSVTELHEAFDPPVIHRDLKPQNIILHDGHVWLIDLSIAREFKAGATADTMYFGTREYSPPEQFGFGQTDTRSDVYALGKLLAYCTFGDATLQDTRGNAKDSSGTCEGNNANDDSLAGSSGGSKDPSVMPAPSGKPIANPPFDSRMQAVYDKACALDPKARYASAAELKIAYMDALDLHAKQNVITNWQFNKTSEDELFAHIAQKDKEAKTSYGVISLEGINDGLLEETCSSGIDISVVDTTYLEPVQNRVSGFFAHIRNVINAHRPLRVVCWIWDAYLAAIALFILLIVILCVFFPGDVDDAKMPLFYRFIEYNGMFGFPCLALLYAISWREPIRNIWPNAKLLSRLKAVGLALACFFAVFIVLTIFRTILGY